MSVLEAFIKNFRIGYAKAMVKPRLPSGQRVGDREWRDCSSRNLFLQIPQGPRIVCCGTDGKDDSCYRGRQNEVVGEVRSRNIKLDCPMKQRRNFDSALLEFDPE